MGNVTAGLSALAILVFFLALEQCVIRASRQRLRVVIRVTGTRGKSTVTRMVHALLREAGFRAVGRTTGTEPRILLPDGNEKALRRIAPGNVREQRSMLIYAVRAGADAAVLECNALRPAMLMMSSAYSRADLLIITNARDDHRYEQGSADEAARAMAASIPRQAVVISADLRFHALYAAAARQRGARLIDAAATVAPAESRDPAAAGPEPNLACARAAGRWLGLTPERVHVALSGYRRDPGAFCITAWRDSRARTTWFADALAANDVESTIFWADHTLRCADADPTLTPFYTTLVVVNRADRPVRALQFARYAAAAVAPHGPFSSAVVVGPLPLSARRVLTRCGGAVEFVSRTATLEKSLHAAPIGENQVILAVGNWLGPGECVRRWALAHSGAAEIHPRPGEELSVEH